MITVSGFANRIRAKYNAYHDVSDDELTRRILEKYPVYKEQVDTSTFGTSGQEQKPGFTPRPIGNIPVQQNRPPETTGVSPGYTEEFRKESPSFRKQRSDLHAEMMSKGERLANHEKIAIEQGKTPEEFSALLDDEMKKQLAYYKHMKATEGGTAFASAAAASAIPFGRSLLSEEQKLAQEKHPTAKTTGEVVGTTAQALVGGAAIAKQLGKIGAIAKSKVLTSALSRITTAGAITGTRGIEDVATGKKQIGEAIADTIQSGGAGLISVIPEIVAPANAWQLLAQPMADLIYDASVDAARGKKVLSKEWLKNELINLAISEGFAIKDVASGETFKYEQSKMKEELPKWLGGKKKGRVLLLEHRPDIPEHGFREATQAAAKEKLGKAKAGVASGKPISAIAHGLPDEIAFKQKGDPGTRKNRAERRALIEAGMKEQLPISELILQKWPDKIPTKKEVSDIFGISREDAALEINKAYSEIDIALGSDIVEQKTKVPQKPAEQELSKQLKKTSRHVKKTEETIKKEKDIEQFIKDAEKQDEEYQEELRKESKSDTAKEKLFSSAPDPKDVRDLEVIAKQVPKEKKTKEAIPEQKIASMEQEPGQIASGELAYGQDLPKKVPGANLEKVINKELDLLGSGDEAYTVKKLIVQTAGRYGTAIESARRGKVTHEETRAAVDYMAETMGIGQEKLLKRLKKQAYNNEEILMAHDTMVTSAKKTLDIINEYNKKPTGEITAEDRAKIRLALQVHGAVQAEFAGARAEAGRALNALKIMAKNYEGKNFETIIEGLGGKELNDKIIDKILSIDPENINAINSFAHALTKITNWDKINEYWVNAILSAPTTHIVNITSNTLSSLYRPTIEKATAATIEALIAPLQGRKRKVFFGEIPREVINTFTGIREGTRAAVEAFKTEMPSFDKLSKLEATRFQSIGGKLGKIIRTPGRALLAADEVFKWAIYRGQISADAYREAKFLGLKGEALSKKYAELKNNPTEKMVNKARNEASYRTFTQKLDKISSKIYGIRDIPGVRYVVPFVRTPTNIAKFAIERTPIGFVDKIRKVSKKEITDEQISEEFAKPVIGSMMMAGVVMLAREGFITGAGPKDRDKRYSLYRTGWQPYSIKIGDKYYSFARLEPLGSLLGMASDFSESGENEKNLTDIAERMAYSVGRNIISKTYMQGLSNAFELLSPTGYEPMTKKWGDYFKNMGASFVPNVIRSIASATDSELKKKDGIIDEFQSRVPGLTQFIYPRRDIWGRKIDRRGNFWTRFVSPVQYSAATGDKVDQEMVDIGISISPVSKSMELDKKYKIEGNVKLTPEEYDEYSKRVGQSARTRIENIMRKGSYKRATNDDKIDMIKKEFSDARRSTKISMQKKVYSRIKKEETVKLSRR